MISISNSRGIQTYCIIILIILLGCNEEEKLEYPMVQTGDVATITSEGATFHGKITNQGAEEIIDHGFVWDTLKVPTVAIGYTVSLGPYSTDIYHAKVTSAFVEGKTYYLRAYLKYPGRTVYGRIVSFVSLGSKSPLITDFNPQIATWGDTLLIRGENFSLKKEDNKVEIGGYLSDVIEAKADQLIIIVPEELDTTNVDIKLRFLNNVATSKVKFQLQPPVIAGFNPEKGSFADAVRIFGKYFGKGKTQVYFNDIEAAIDSVNDTGIYTRVPSGLPEGNVKLKVIVAHQTAIANKDFTSTSPRITAISPEQGTWNDIITIEGLNFSDVSDENIVRFNQTTAEVVSSSANLLEVKVPADLLTEKSTVSIEVKEQIHEHNTQFKLSSPVIHSFSPQQATFRDVITITGENFNPVIANNKAFFGETKAKVIECTPTTLNVQVPDGYYAETGKTKIELDIGDLNVTSSMDFGLSIHTITYFDPVNADRNDTITIHGTDFNPVPELNEVFLDDFKLNIISAASSQIRVTIPSGIEHGNHILKVNVAGRSTTANDPITVYEPWKKVTDFPGVPRRSAISFSLNGFGFVGGGIGTDQSALTDFYKYDAASNRWEQLSNLPFSDFNDLSFTSSADHGYFMIGSQIWQYDPLVDSWEQLTAYQGLGSYTSWPHILFEIDNILYISSGVVKSYGKPDREYILAYNISLDSWRYKNSYGFPAEYGFGFVIDNIGYRNTREYLFKYNVINDSWVRSFEYPNYTIQNPAVFSINKLGYIVTTGWVKYPEKKSNKVFEYNPVGFTTTQMVAFPGGPRTQLSYFVIGEKGYVGLGSDRNKGLFNDFYEFDPSKIKR